MPVVFLDVAQLFYPRAQGPKTGVSPREEGARGPESFEGKKMETASRGRATEPTATNGRAFVSEHSRPLLLLLARATRPRKFCTYRLHTSAAIACAPEGP